ncbi:MAG TPA: FAD-binding protein [Blastocatellia bacterium]|nr:FAD-binding protein [Blastocatellia bacterium]
MRLIVCIKQVPEVAEIKFNPQTNTIVREGVPNVVNPFDRRALAEAIRLRDLYGGEVVVLTMGPPQAREALIDCLGAGADRALHLVDSAFAGSDTLATARAIALALKRESYDIILCGKYSVDSETAQVGPEIAEFLNLPQVTGATKLEISDDHSSVIVERETDDGFETIESALPVLLTASERLIRPIKVKESHIEAGRLKPIQAISAADLSDDTNIFGFAGSPTRVQEIKSIARARQVEMIEGGTADEKASQLLSRLKSLGALDTEQTKEAREAAPDSKRPLPGGREVWVFTELLDGRLRSVSFELLGKGIELARKLKVSLGAIIVGSRAADYSKSLAAHGADRIYLAEDERLDRYTTTAYTSFVTDAIRAHRPSVLLLPSTANGRDLAPRVAARLGVGLTGDCVDVDVNERGELEQYKPAFGGNIVALITSTTLPQIATVKPSMLRSAGPNESRVAEIVRLAIPEFDDHRQRLVSSRREVSADIVELDAADRVICVGAGIGGPENLEAIYALAGALDAQVGATRRVVDQGWLPRHQQIGLTGKVLSPALYIGVAVRGSLNHTIGIQQAGTIVAINNDANADVFHTADLGVVADWREFVSALTEKLGSVK